MNPIKQDVFAERIRHYLRALERGDVEGVVALFSPEATLYSPLLGWQAPEAFYCKLAQASGNSTITLLDLFASTQGHRRASAYFHYDWQLNDGSRVAFDCVDVFDFNASGLIERLVIIYDTQPIRADLGDRFR
ncbi:MAG: nuclear transport factor 2 family protein [Paludibacterium sp.]|uniref:nuclear transport factor 2 family protein n=1 Tax=Paludibacterium sp. TaxID=1917523 RepID=UPI0025D4B690|nr:nuclear transport factor 2 family protein [Paludibacterium sp.]MBV8048685.1 nuclear transport factor 2 family protein [Paludibacterium sp.]